MREISAHWAYLQFIGPKKYLSFFDLSAHKTAEWSIWADKYCLNSCFSLPGISLFATHGQKYYRNYNILCDLVIFYRFQCRFFSLIVQRNASCPTLSLAHLLELSFKKYPLLLVRSITIVYSIFPMRPHPMGMFQIWCREMGVGLNLFLMRPRKMGIVMMCVKKREDIK